MKYSIGFIISLSLIVSSCSWWGGDTKNVQPSHQSSPYPSVPMSGETITANQEITGASYSARGTEPFWSAEILPGETTFSRPGESEVITKKFETQQNNTGAIITIKDIKGEFFITLTKGNCSDGMSEEKYNYNAMVLVGAETLTGCAVKK